MSQNSSSANGGTAAHKSFEVFIAERRYETGSLAMKANYKPVVPERGRMNKVPPSITLARQPYRHVDYLEFMNAAEIHSFTKYWTGSLKCAKQRAGWMYGYYIEDPQCSGGCRAVVEAIYEPPQSTEGDLSIPNLDDKFKQTVDAIAEKLSLECVGLIYTTIPRDITLTSQEAILASMLQLKSASAAHYTRYPISKFVLCQVKLDADGRPDTMAYMVSDQMMAMYRDGLIDNGAAISDPRNLTLKSPSVVSGGVTEIMPYVLQSGISVKKFDTDWVVVKVNSGSPVNPVPRFGMNLFSRENRTECGKEWQQHPEDIQAYLTHASTSLGLKSHASYKLYSDFHFIIYVARCLDVNSALALCAILESKENIPEPLYAAIVQAAKTGK